MRSSRFIRSLRSRMSAVDLLNIDGVEEIFFKVVELVGRSLEWLTLEEQGQCNFRTIETGLHGN